MQVIILKTLTEISEAGRTGVDCTLSTRPELVICSAGASDIIESPKKTQSESTSQHRVED